MIPGEKYGRLTILRRASSGKNYTARWLCRCECGVDKIIRADKLKSGRTKSCGCMMRGKRTHGMTRTRTYRIWRGMKQRCFVPKQTGFENYGGRGITLCDHWMDFENFYNDMGDCPDGMTIERKNNQLNYEPSNCIWASMREQQRNRRNNICIEMNGHSRLLIEWCEILNANYHTVYARLHRGMRPENAFNLCGDQA